MDCKYFLPLGRLLFILFPLMYEGFLLWYNPIFAFSFTSKKLPWPMSMSLFPSSNLTFCWFLYLVADTGPISFFCWWITSFLSTICWRGHLFPTRILGTLIDQLTKAAWIFLGSPFFPTWPYDFYESTLLLAL